MSKSGYTIEEIKSVIAEYPVGKLLKTEHVTSGKMNINLAVTTTTGKYLLKKYYLTIFYEKELLAQHKFLEHLARQNVKVVPALATDKGKTVVIKRKCRYVLFPFIESAQPPQKITQRHYIDGAQNLARFHVVARDYPSKVYSHLKPWPECIQKVTKSFYQGSSYHKTKSVKSLLYPKKKYDAFDKFVLAHEGWLARLRDELLHAGKHIRYRDLTYVHFDFQPANLLYNEQGTIIAIVDFDQVHRDIMQLDLVKAVRFFALNPHEKSINFTKARWFVEAYIQENPIRLNPNHAYYFLLFQVLRRLYYMLELYYNHGYETTKIIAQKDFALTKFLVKNKKQFVAALAKTHSI